MISQPDDTNSLRLRVIVNLTVWCSGAGHHDISTLSRSWSGAEPGHLAQLWPGRFSWYMACVTTGCLTRCRSLIAQ